MQVPALNITIVIIAILLATAVYGLLAGKQRLRILILSVYVGIVISDQLASTVAYRVPSLGEDQIALLLFGLPIAIFGLVGIAHSKDHDKGAFIANLIVGLLTGALIVTSAMHVLPVSQMSSLNNDSFLAMNLNQAYLWLLGLLPVVALLLGFMRAEPGKKSHH